jgi:hypothetical protein
LQKSGTVHDFFQAAYRRIGSVAGAAAHVGPLVSDANGLGARFTIALDGDRLSSVQYRCSTCVTLVALCEHLSQAVSGTLLANAETLDAEHLLSLHPEIPGSHQDRATLAIASFRAALKNSTGEQY